MSETIGSNRLCCKTEGGLVVVGFACPEHGLQYAMEFTGSEEDRLLRVADCAFLNLPYWFLPCSRCGLVTIGPLHGGARMEDGVLHIPELPEAWLDELRGVVPKFES